MINGNISIIIVTCQGQKWYDRSIGEWFSGNIDNLNVNVVVVDNSPTEDDARLSEKLLNYYEC